MSETSSVPTALNADESPIAAKRSPRWRRQALISARKMNLFLWLEILSAISLVTMLGAAWFYLGTQNDTSQMVPPMEAAAMLVGTLIPALALIVLRGRRIAIRRTNGSTARLHVTLVFFFSLIAAIPTLFVAIFASLLFQSGVDFWFSNDSRGIMENASEVATGFYNENQRDVADNTTAMAVDISHFLQDNSLTSPEFEEFYFLQVYYRELNESAILQQGPDGSLHTIVIVDPDIDADRQRVSPDDISRLRKGESVVVQATPERIESVMALDQELGVYLYAARKSDPAMVALYSQAQTVVESYDALTTRARALQVQFNLALFAVSLTLVAVAVWAALRFADRQVKPLAELADAAREIGSGNYAMRVDGRTGSDEIGLLNRAFNRMSAQIERQTDALRGASEQSSQRRAFIEAVLQSITAGIISIDGDGRVLLTNASAERLLLKNGEASPIGEELSKIAPQLTSLLDDENNSGIVQINHEGELLTLAVKIAGAADGHVITFDDITRQLLDQRQAAWSDVARRIAHEIKNPLTPIQLATERLKRRYFRQIEEDPELFEELTGTIIRQVGSLRKMVDEFSSFARLPKPNFRNEDAVDLVRQSLFLQEVAHPEITYSCRSKGDIPHIDCDRHQFGQAMTNVLKNAAEAVGARKANAPAEWRATVKIAVSLDAHHIVIDISDNGIGLPKDKVNIIEPYVTTREKGTGLGLAIVKKIVEEHGGDLAFTNIDEGGACASLRFAIDPVLTLKNTKSIAAQSSMANAQIDQEITK